MGGQETAVNQSTREIFLESGVFNSSSVRATSKKLALRSESSLRFEKGTDLETAYIASLRAVELLKELAGAEEESFGEKITLKSKPIKISLDSNSLDKLVGLSVPKNKVGEILKNLNLSPKTKSTGWNCLIPSYRKDLLEERDLMEEVIRVVGYDKIPNRITVGQPNPVPKQFLKKKTGDLEDILKGLGVHQTLTSTFMAQNITEPFVSSRELVPLANPLSQEESFMRPLLLPALLKAVQLNLHHQRLSARFFEIGNVFRKTETNFQEESHMGLVLFGSSRPESWQSKPAPLDIYELKGIFDLLNSHWDFPFKLAEREIKNYLHPHQSFQILYRNQEIGMMGMLHPSLMRLFDLPAPPAVMELNLGDWLEARKIRPSVVRSLLQPQT
jgi:phenylalanyl-tRNA synthetase beta chain